MARNQISQGNACSDIFPIRRYNRMTRHLVDIGVPAEKEVIQ